MQLIGTYQILRLLGNLAVLRRQKLRTHRRIQHVVKHSFQLLIFGCVRIATHQMPYQGFGDGSVDPIHRHMVPVISRPAKRQLRHITGSDYQTALLISNVHNHLRPLPCLTVLIGYAVVFRVMADVFEMLCHRILNRHLPKLCSQRQRHLAGIVISPVSGAETGHGHRKNLLSVKSQSVKCFRRHQKRQRRI